MVLLTGCNKKQTGEIAVLEPSDFAAKLKSAPGAQLLDVRTAEEFAKQHLDNARNVDWYQAEVFVQETAALDKSKPVFIYCMAGSRSKKAADLLREQGFSQVYDMKGGIVKWNADGLSPETTKTPEQGISPNDFRELISGSDRVLVDFYAPWCEPCKKMKPYLDQMAADDPSLKIIRLNADQEKTMARQLDISELPLLLYFENGTKKWSHTGYISESDLKSNIK